MLDARTLRPEHRFVPTALRALLLAIACWPALATAQKPGLLVTLKYIPTDAEEVLEKRGVVPVGGPAFELSNAIDSRPDRLDLIGRNIEKRDSVNVFSRSPVAPWVTQVLFNSFREWGTPSSPNAGLVVEPEILKLFVEEENTYKAEVTMKFRLKRRDGTEIWAGVVGGAASRFGRSLKEENYQEVLSDALLSCISKFWADPAFREAWASGKDPKASPGASASTTPRETLTPEAARAKLLALQEAGLDDETLAAWIRKIDFTRPLTADDLIDWRGAGIPQAAIKAALE